MECVVLNRRPGVLTFVLAAGIAAGLSGTAQADPGEPPLKGPKVVDRRAPGADGNFGAPDENRRPGLSPRFDVRAFREAMREALGPDAPADVRGTPEQRERVHEIVQEHMEAVRAYMEQHRDELQSLRKKTGDRPDGRKPPGRRGPADQQGAAPVDEERGTVRPVPDEATRQQFKALMDGAPKPEAMVNRVWQELTPEQRAAVESRMDEIKRERASERDQRMFEGKARKKEPGKADGRGARDEEPRKRRRARRDNDGTGEPPAPER